LQRDALTEAGCDKIFTEQMSGAVADRPALHDALEFSRSGDTLIVWKLDLLARSMKQLIETIESDSGIAKFFISAINRQRCWEYQ
jgi:DNA invertase Pin-like site-specific DNA recombinase